MWQLSCLTWIWTISALTSFKHVCTYSSISVQYIHKTCRFNNNVFWMDNAEWCDYYNEKAETSLLLQIHVQLDSPSSSFPWKWLGTLAWLPTRTPQRTGCVAHRFQLLLQSENCQGSPPPSNWKWYILNPCFPLHHLNITHLPLRHWLSFCKGCSGSSDSVESRS